MFQIPIHIMCCRLTVFRLSIVSISICVNSYDPKVQLRIVVKRIYRDSLSKINKQNTPGGGGGGWGGGGGGGGICFGDSNVEYFPALMGPYSFVTPEAF